MRSSSGNPIKLCPSLSHRCALPAAPVPAVGEEGPAVGVVGGAAGEVGGLGLGEAGVVVGARVHLHVDVLLGAAAGGGQGLEIDTRGKGRIKTGLKL